MTDDRVTGQRERVPHSAIDRASAQLDLAGLAQAEGTLMRFPHALKIGDEEATAALAYPPSLSTWGTAAGHVRTDFLSAWGIADDELDRLGVVHTARILPAMGAQPRVAFGLLGWGGTTPRIIGHPTPARALALIWDVDAWRVWGTPDPDEFAAAALVPLPTEGTVHDEMLSVLSAEWIMALQPHLDALRTLEHAAGDSDAMVSPRESAHAVASIVMLVFAIESHGARLAALGRLAPEMPQAIIDGLPDADLQQHLTELVVARNVVAHNHVWRLAMTADGDSQAVTVDSSEHIFGERERRNYRAAVAEGADRTKRLRLHVIPTAARRLDVAQALATAVRVFDDLAAKDVPNMRSLADHPVRVGGRVRRLRDVEVDGFRSE